MRSRFLQQIAGSHLSWGPIFNYWSIEWTMNCALLSETFSSESDNLRIRSNGNCDGCSPFVCAATKMVKDVARSLDDIFCKFFLAGQSGHFRRQLANQQQRQQAQSITCLFGARLTHIGCSHNLVAYFRLLQSAQMLFICRGIFASR